jgi:penicillin amidase
VNPEQGYVVSANNDPGGLSFDGSLTNDPWYIGGPWQDGYRPNQISEQLESRIASGGVTIDGMKAVQADHTSSVGQQLVPELLDAIDAARALEGLTVEDSEARVWDLYDANRDRIDEVASRLAAWQVRDYQAESGVETFYESPTAEEQQDAVATMIFNAWVGRFMTAAVSDEGFPGLGFPTGTTGRFRLLKRLLDGRGPDNPLSMGSWNPDTEESVYFDDLRTEAFETSTEIALVALVDALDFLESPPTEPGKGGFGTDDMDQWLWGMRHWVRFTSLLGDFFGVDDPILGPLIDPLNIDSDTFPVAEGLSSDDPRAELPGFPRHGDLEGIDALNPGSDGVRFDNSYGSVFRMVVALGQDGFEAWNVIPGGQSGLTDSPFVWDQAELWLGNDYIRVHLDPADVAAAAVTREVFE